ncbi:centromere protein T isoform X2 [Parambassis ranga]|uniref:Centromere protein T isoform X2 n=1 Tax=Parambassis ranga TaxID=210632 RepID=A0A6P7KI59_9TELE|nr:centromere protein T isoform X2 [Parambassis ranga]
MDTTEDLSARVLLRNILSTEPPMTPITNSVPQGPNTNRQRRSNRLSQRDAQTPQDMLRRSLRQKLRESITRKSLPANKRRTTSTLRQPNKSATTSMLFNEGDTPRHILMNILQTEPVKSPVVHEKGAPEDSEAPSTSSISSIELSGLELPDLTLGNAASTATRLTRKRPRRILNVTAFEKCLKSGDVDEDQITNSTDDHSSLSLSSTSLNLKTPFVEVQTEKRGLLRKVSNRRKITEEEFGAAVNKQQIKGASSFVQAQQDLAEVTNSEGFTLGLSKLSEPDITTDIVHCNTALYALPNATTSNFSIVATQDKPTIMASQIQRDMREKVEETRMEGELGKEKSMYLFPNEEEDMARFPLQEEADGGETLKEEARRRTTMLKSEEKKDVAEFLTSLRDDKTVSDEAEEKDAQSEDADNSHPVEDVEAGSQSEEQEFEPSSQTEEEKDEEEVAADSEFQDNTEAEAEEEEDSAPDSQTEEEEEEAHSQSQEDVEAESQSNEDEDVATSQNGDESDGTMEEEEEKQALEQQEHVSEHMGHMLNAPNSALIMPVAEGTETAHRNSTLEMPQPYTNLPDLPEYVTHVDAAYAEYESDKDSFHPPEVMEYSDIGPLEEAAPQESSEQEGEWEEEEDELPLKTPAFVKEKRNFFLPRPLVSPPVFKDDPSGTSEAVPSAKPKQVRQRKSRSTKKEACLPKNYLMGVFKHFAKTKVSADVYPVLSETMDKYFDRLAEDLETYAVHAKRKTIDVKDAELLLRRQGYVNNKVPVEVLIEKYLRMDQRQLLIPIATKGNVVFPKKPR